MASKNDITGDEIKSRILSAQGRANWDKAFCKKSAHEWANDEPNIIRIIDADGWRRDDGVTLDTPISYGDFCERINYSTIIANITP
jgi:hypothetical protein